MAMRIDRQLSDVDLFLAHDTLDGSTGLTLIIEDEGLGVEDAPAVTDVGVQAHRGSLATWVKPGLPDPFGGLETHHVGGRQIRAPPGSGNGEAVHEREHRPASLGEPAFIGGPTHRLPYDGSRDLRDHAGGLRGR